jgi:hypothetical protein
MAESADTGRAPADREAADGAPADRVRDLLGNGYIDARRAQAVELAVPEVREEVLDWLGDFARAGAWRDFGAFANLAVHLRPDALPGVLAPVIGAGTQGADLEDLVEVIAEAGQAGACGAEAVPALSGLVDLRAPTDGPHYGLCLKAVAALGCFRDPAAGAALRALAVGDLPEPVRRQAAAALGRDSGP